MAGARPLVRQRAEAGLHGIERDIAQHRQEMLVALYESGSVPALEEMAAAVMPAVERLCVAAVHVPHADREIRPRRPHDEVVVVLEKAVREVRPAAELAGMTEPPQELVAVALVLENPLARVAAVEDVVDAVGDEWTERAGHHPPSRQRPCFRPPRACAMWQ